MKRDLAKKNESLEQQIMKRQAERESSANSFFDKLLEKYGGSDDSDEYEPVKKLKKSVSKKLTPKSSKKPLHNVKRGRVQKK